ncbi:MAG TPA: SDR family NAD(P)-dependent oxidoreductase [Actinomycetota bacterium]|nr:SDR family NAD(P)-dependent oxidoreductase [Actinomycetota bacterium]
MELNGASVLLTGGSRGIGPHIARALLARGATVTLAARSKDGLERVRESLGTDRVAVVPADVTDEDGRSSAVAAAEEAFGRIDVLVNNAGIEHVLRFVDHSEEDISSIVRVNLEAPMLLARQVLPGMLEHRHGHIVNISSVAGKAAVPYNTVYAGTKHALVGWSLSLRAELHRSGVGVSVICPGYVAEAGFVEHRLVEAPFSAGTGTTPREVAAAVVRAVERDLPEVIVSGFLPRLSDITLAISPRLFEAAARRSGGWLPLQREADARARARRGE